jgi:hypothetical protein
LSLAGIDVAHALPLILEAAAIAAANRLPAILLDMLIGLCME